MGEDTLLFRAQQHRDRWSGFGSDAGILNLSQGPPVAQLKSIDVFKEFDEAFLTTISADVSIAIWAPNAILFEEGSYVDVAFYILEGEVGVYLATKQGEAAPGQLPIFETQRMGELSSANAAQTGTVATIYQRQADLLADSGSAERVLLSVMDFDLPSETSTVVLGAGEFFGEIGALNGWPQSVTARTRTKCRVVQIRLPALRLMKRRSRLLKKRLDALYRERSLLPHLLACPVFEHCPPRTLADVAAAAELVSCNPDEVVLEEGAPIDALYLVRSGFMKLSKGIGDGRRALSYVSKGMTIGEVELLVDDIDGARFTVSSVGYGELVKIPRAEIDRLRRTLPSIEEGLWQRVVERIRDTGASLADSRRSEFVEVALREGLVEGNSILVIDLEQCTRCDDCVRACANTHQGRPRFIREGERLGRLLVAKSCYHCQDPVCLVGCPTGAIRRANVGDVVEIKEQICIGCGTCSGNCPYDAIVMHGTGTTWPANALPKPLRGMPREVASKCDLCYTSPAGPACVRNCPQGCAYRVGSLDEFERLQHGDGRE